MDTIADAGATCGPTPPHDTSPSRHPSHAASTRATAAARPSPYPRSAITSGPRRSAPITRSPAVSRRARSAAPIPEAEPVTAMTRTRTLLYLRGGARATDSRAGECCGGWDTRRAAPHLQDAASVATPPSGPAWSPTAWRRTSRGTGPRRSTTASTRRWSASAPGSVPCPARSPGSPRSLPELLQQRLRLAQVARVEALGEPAVDRGEQVARLRRAALGLEPAAKARGRAQLERLRPLAPGEVHRLPVARLHRGGLRALPGQQIAAEAKEIGLPHLLGRRAEGVLYRPQRVGEGTELRLPLSQQPPEGSEAEAIPRCRVRGLCFAELRDALLAVPLLRQRPSAVEGARRNVVRELLLGGELDERLRDLPRPIGFAEQDVEGGHHHLGEYQVKRLLQALREGEGFPTVPACPVSEAEQPRNPGRIAEGHHPGIAWQRAMLLLVVAGDRTRQVLPCGHQFSPKVTGHPGRKVSPHERRGFAVRLGQPQHLVGEHLGRLQRTAAEARRPE